jgi:hypothetical protein
MKQKLLLNCIIALIFSSSAFAQFQKGDKILGLGLNFGTNKNENSTAVSSQVNRTFVVNVSTELGFAVNENRVHGFFINGGYGRSRYDFPSQPINTSKTNNYNAGAGYFIRNYKPLGKSFFIFGDGRAGFNYSDQNYTSNTAEKGKSYGVQAAIYPGIAYKLNKRFLLEVRFADLVSLGYSKQESTNSANQKSEQNAFSFGSSLGAGYLKDISIGARWIIRSKRKA